MDMFDKEVIYASIKTSEPFSNHKAIEKWIYNTIVYQNIVKYYKSCFFAPSFEKDFSREAFDTEATIYIDILSGHSAKRRQKPTRPKLEKIIASNNISIIHVYDFSLLGDSIDEVLDIYKKCADKNIAITCINYALPNESEPFSSGLSSFGFKLEMYKNAIAYIKSCDIANSRGHVQKDLSINFIHALLLYEGYLISEDAAIALSGLSANTFHSKSYDIETHPRDYAIQIPFGIKTPSTYAEILNEWMSYYGTNPKIGFSSEDYTDSPKRYGNVPMTRTEKIEYENAKKTAAESKKLFKQGLCSEILKIPDQNAFCKTFRILDDDSFEMLDNYSLYQKLVDLELPLITAIDFKRYRKKLHLMDKNKRYRINTTGSPLEAAIYKYLETVPNEQRQEEDFINWYINC